MINIIEVSSRAGQVSQTGPNGLREQGTGSCLDFYGSLRGWGLDEVHAERGLLDLNLPLVPKVGAPRPSYQLDQVWGRG